MFRAADAARYLDDAHRTRARYQNLPEAIAPKTVAEAYAAQAALVRAVEAAAGARRRPQDRHHDQGDAGS